MWLEGEAGKRAGVLSAKTSESSGWIGLKGQALGEGGRATPPPQLVAAEARGDAATPSLPLPLPLISRKSPHLRYILPALSLTLLTLSVEA